MDLSAIRRIFAKIPSGTLYVGFSGGADSTALLLLARRFENECGYRLKALHFEHGLRGEESRREAENAAAFAEGRGIPFLRIDLHLAPGPDAENRARAARLAEYERIAVTEPGCAFALGHHQDDQVENLLFRLCRGSNVSGLTGLRAETRIGRVRILRPLLTLSREEIEAFLRDEGVQTWNSDSSNQDCRFRRNLLRNRILPDLCAGIPGSRTGLRRAAEVLAEDADFLERSAESAWSSGGADTAAFWTELHPALVPRVLRIGFREKCGADAIPSPDAAARFREVLAERREETICFSECCAVSVAGGQVRFFRREAPAEGLPPLLWDWRSVPSVRRGGWEFFAEVLESHEVSRASLEEAFFDLEAFPSAVVLRDVLPGDRLIPFGRTAPGKLKKLRIDRGVPASEGSVVLVTPEGTICWAPGVRHSAFSPVREGGRILHFFRRPLP